MGVRGWTKGKPRRASLKRYLCSVACELLESYDPPGLRCALQPRPPLLEAQSECRRWPDVRQCAGPEARTFRNSGEFRYGL